MRKKLFFISTLMVCASVNAQTFSGGSGTQADPYLLSSIADLETLNNLTNQGGALGKYFLLTQDITEPFTGMIGTEGAFNGYFDGGGHCINVNINRPWDTYPVGLFGTATRGYIRNLAVEGQVAAPSAAGIVGNPATNVVLENLVNYADVSGSKNVGGVVADMVSLNGTNGCHVVNCANYGTITSDGIGGGVVGYSGQQVGNRIERVANYGLVVGVADNVWGSSRVVGGVIGNPLWNDVVGGVVNLGTISDHSISGCMGKTNPETQADLYYDAQYCPSDIVFPTQAKLTSEVIGNGLANDAYLSPDYWLFEEDMLPRLRTGMENDPRAILYATPAILHPDDQLDNISHDFRVVRKNGVKWASATGKVSIDSDGTAHPVELGDDELHALLDGYTHVLYIHITGTTANGIAALDDATDEPTAVYDLQGRKLAAPARLPRGIYIVKKGKSITKRRL